MRIFPIWLWADPYEDDQLRGLAWRRKRLRQRDQLVIEAALAPVVCRW